MFALAYIHTYDMQVRRDQRHVAKWRHMLGGSAADFEAYRAAKMAKVKRRVRKGIPDEFRGYVWQLLSGVGEEEDRRQACRSAVCLCIVWQQQMSWSSRE